MRHQWDVPACWFTGSYAKASPSCARHWIVSIISDRVALQLVFAAQFIMPLSHSFSKATILLLFLQIFTVDKKMRIAIYFGLVFTALSYWPNLILVPIFSVPYSGQTWQDVLSTTRIHKMTPVGTEQGTMAVLLDIYIFLLPVPAIMKLKMASRDRWRLLIVFGTAFWYVWLIYIRLFTSHANYHLAEWLPVLLA